jgi:hypothetical protein
MSSSMIETGCPGAAAWPVPVEFDVRRLTTGQLRTLGLARIAYLTVSRPGDGLEKYVIRGADGIAVAAFDELDLVAEVLDRLRLALVSLH